MSLITDTKYANLLSASLHRFSYKGNNVWQFRCPVCGDSKKNKWKARGYMYKPAKGQTLRFKCHNCSANMSIGDLIKFVDQELFREYKMERYSENRISDNTANPTDSFKMKQPQFTEPRLIDKILDRVDKLPDDNICKQYVMSRQIPEDKWDRLYYLDDFSKVGGILKKYEDRIKTNEPRLIIPFWNESGKMTGLVGRDLSNDVQLTKYLTLKVDESVPFIYGIDTVDPTKKFYVVEGQIDSLFLPNAIAACTSDLSRVIVSPKIKVHMDNAVLIFDNQPRNKEIVRQVKKAIDRGYKVVLWPMDGEQKVDINNLVVDYEMSVDSIVEMMDNNTYSGLKARALFSQWAKVV